MAAYEAWQNGLTDHDSILRDLYVESPFAHPSVVYRREPVERAGGYRALGWPEDYDLWLRLAAAGARFARLPEVLLYWRDRPERFTRTDPACTLEAFRACRITSYNVCYTKLLRRSWPGSPIASFRCGTDGS